MTSNQQLYNKQIRRIQNAIRRLEKQGYDTSLFELPEKPKKITQKQLRELASIKPETIRRQSSIYDYETGETVDYITDKNRAKNIAKHNVTIFEQEADWKAEFDREGKRSTTISYYDIIKGYILELLPDEAVFYASGRKGGRFYDLSERKNELINMLDNLYATSDDADRYLEDHEQEIKSEIDAMLSYIPSGEGEFFRSFVRLGALLQGGWLTPEQAETMSDYSDYIYTRNEAW